jgi:hypothetical protein
LYGPVDCVSRRSFRARGSGHGLIAPTYTGARRVSIRRGLGKRVLHLGCNLDGTNAT